MSSTHGEVLIRRALPADALPAARVLVRSRHHAVPAIPPLAHSNDEVETWFATFVIREREVWVAETVATVGSATVGSERALVGVMVLDGPSIEQLYLEPGWTGQGLGTRLVEQAKVQRPEGLALWAFLSNAGARRFYEREGFVEVKRTDGSGNEERAPDVRYEWRPRRVADDS